MSAARMQDHGVMFARKSASSSRLTTGEHLMVFLGELRGFLESDERAD